MSLLRYDLRCSVRVSIIGEVVVFVGLVGRSPMVGGSCDDGVAVGAHVGHSPDPLPLATLPSHVQLTGLAVSGSGRDVVLWMVVVLIGLVNGSGGDVALWGWGGGGGRVC